MKTRVSLRYFVSCFVKKVVLKSFANFAGKQLCYSLFLITRLQYRCFPVNLAKFVQKTFFEDSVQTNAFV